MKQTENTLQNVLSQLSMLKPQLQNNYPIKTLAVFGSLSRGDATDESDIDILVEFYKPVGMDYIRLALELENYLHRKVDLVSKGGLKEKYFNAISKDLIYV